MTPFGARLRAMRDQRGITLSEMASSLNITPAYLSALEHGKRGRPSWQLVQGVIAYFNVIWDEAEELMRLAELSHPKVTVDTAGMTPEATELANLLARDVGKLSREDAADLVQRLKRAAGEKG